MYTFGTTIDNKYLQLTQTTIGSGFDIKSNYKRVDFDSLTFIDVDDFITLQSFDVPSYPTSSIPKYNIDDNEVTYSGKPSFIFNSQLSGSIYSILTGTDLTNFNHYTFSYLFDDTYFNVSTKLTHTSAGKPIIKKINGNFVKFWELTGSDIHNINQWILSDSIASVANYEGYNNQNKFCDFTLNNNDGKIALVTISQDSKLIYHQLTGANVNGPYTNTVLLTSEELYGTSISFNSGGKVAFCTSRVVDLDGEFYNSLVYIQLTGSDYQNKNDLSYVYFDNLSGVYNPKLNFSTKESKPSIVYYDANNLLHYFTLTGNNIDDIDHWVDINLNLSAYYCDFKYQPENSFYPCAPVISYNDNNNYLNVVQLTGSNYFEIEPVHWGSHSLNEIGSNTYLEVISGEDPIELAYIPLKNPLTYPIADVAGISYYDDTNDSLKYAQLTGNNFSDINDWGDYTVDNASVVGQYSSLQFISGSSPAIAYHDNVTGDLKYAQLTGNNFDEQQWGILTLDNANDTGEYTSLKIINNRPAISYINQTDNTLNYIELTGANFDEVSNWGKVVVDNISVFNAFTSLSLNSAFKPGISYYDSTNDSLKLAQLTGGDFTDTNNWGIYTIPKAGVDAGQYTSLNYTSANKPSIAYINGITSDLSYTTLTGDNDDSWGIINLTNSSPANISLQFTPYNDKPAISYKTANLKVGYLQLTGADTFNVNSWSVNELDRSGGSTSLQFSSAGAPGSSNYNTTNQLLEYFQLTGVNFQELSSFEQVDLNNENWGLITVASGGDVGDFNSLAFSQYQFVNEYKLSADKLSAFEGETFNLKLSTNQIHQPEVLYYDVSVNGNNNIITSSDAFLPTVIDDIFFDVDNVDVEEKITFTLPQLYNPTEGINPDHTIDIYIGKTTEVTHISSLTALPFDDESCNRIVLKELINPAKDITMSFQTNRDAVNLLTEDNLILLTENNIPLIGEFNIVDGTGFAIFLAEGEKPLDNQHGEPGPGLGILATNSTAFSAMTGHVLSIAFDFAGFYGIKNLFKDSGDRGYLNPRPYTITARVSNVNSQYDFVSSTSFNENIFKYNSPFKCYRVRFKEHLTRIYFDVKDNFSDRYTNLVSYDTNIDFASLPRAVKIGLTYSGSQNLPVKDITYSANVY
jgi:hypothetical protein